MSWLMRSGCRVYSFGFPSFHLLHPPYPSRLWSYRPSPKLTPSPSRSKFFPPTDDLAPEYRETQSRVEADLLAALPDPPKTEPSSEGQPEAKKQKIDSVDLLDQDWEKVEKPDFSTDDELASTKGDVIEEFELDKALVAESPSSTAQHTAQGVGVSMPSTLLQDW